MIYYTRHEAANPENAKANLLNAERLAVKQERTNALGRAAAKIENKMPKTHESLNILGAGRRYGE